MAAARWGYSWGLSALMSWISSLTFWHTKDGDVVAYHIYNRNSFEDYLLDNTCFERGATQKHDYAHIYENDGKMYINLNAQIRFI